MVRSLGTFFRFLRTMTIPRLCCVVSHSCSLALHSPTSQVLLGWWMSLVIVSLPPLVIMVSINLLRFPLHQPGENVGCVHRVTTVNLQCDDWKILFDSESHWLYLWGSKYCIPGPIRVPKRACGAVSHCFQISICILNLHSFIFLEIAPFPLA